MKSTKKYRIDGDIVLKRVTNIQISLYLFFLKVKTMGEVPATLIESVKQDL